MDDPTRRCENDTGIYDAPSGASGPKRSPHFLLADESRSLGDFLSHDNPNKQAIQRFQNFVIPHPRLLRVRDLLFA